MQTTPSAQGPKGISAQIHKGTRYQGYAQCLVSATKAIWLGKGRWLVAAKGATVLARFCCFSSRRVS